MITVPHCSALFHVLTGGEWSCNANRALLWQGPSGACLGPFYPACESSALEVCLSSHVPAVINLWLTDVQSPCIIAALRFLDLALLPKSSRWTNQSVVGFWPWLKSFSLFLQSHGAVAWFTWDILQKVVVKRAPQQTKQFLLSTQREQPGALFRENLIKRHQVATWNFWTTSTGKGELSTKILCQQRVNISQRFVKYLRGSSRWRHQPRVQHGCRGAVAPPTRTAVHTSLNCVFE